MSLLDTLQTFLEKVTSLAEVDESGENGFAREFVVSENLTGRTVVIVIDGRRPTLDQTT